MCLLPHTCEVQLMLLQYLCRLQQQLVGYSRPILQT